MSADLKFALYEDACSLGLTLQYGSAFICDDDTVKGVCIQCCLCIRRIKATLSKEAVLISKDGSVFHFVTIFI
ncbi:hypothetical protein GN956_G16248 [Arapaima gigas]